MAGLLRRRCAVAGRPPRHNVRDVDLRAIKPDGLHHQVEQFSRTADKRQAGDIFVAPRRLADEHDAPLWIAVGEDELRRRGAQHAAFERTEQRAQRLQVLRALGGGACRHHRGFGRGRCGLRERSSFN